MPLFAVLLVRREAGALKDLPGWDAHAAFMDRLVEEGFVLAGGPFEGTRETLLIVAASDELEVARRLDPDPWRRTELISTKWMRRWMPRLGEPF